MDGIFPATLTFFFNHCTEKLSCNVMGDMASGVMEVEAYLKIMSSLLDRMVKRWLIDTPACSGELNERHVCLCLVFDGLFSHSVSYFF